MPFCEVALQRPVQDDAADQRDHAHEQGHVEAVPDREAVVRAFRRPGPTRTAVARKGLMVIAGTMPTTRQASTRNSIGKAHPERRLVRRRAAGPSRAGRRTRRG